MLTLALALLVVVAVVVGLGRQFTPAISDYQVRSVCPSILSG